MEYHDTGFSRRSPQPEPSWPSVIATTLRLWFERHPVFGGKHPRRRRVAAALALVAAVAGGAGVTGVIIGHSARSSSAPAAAAAGASAIRGEAASWITRQV